MQSFFTAIDSLYDAVIFTCVHFFKPRAHEQHTDLVPKHEEPAANTSHSVEVSFPLEKKPDSFKPIRTLLHTDSRVSDDVVKNTVMYAGNISVPLYKNPTIEFDSQIAIIPYGEMVMMLEPRGRFFRVVWNTHEGWVLRDDVVDRAIRVYPEFVIGEENSIDNPNTAHVRSILGDVFALGRSQFPLQAGEYILYRLWKKGIHVMWPSIRPRVPGTWHKILKGVPNVSIGVMPKVGSIMEYMINSDIGHLTYVEAIFPDETLTVSEVNYPDSGIYNERVLTKEEWKEYKPVFLRIS